MVRCLRCAVWKKTVFTTNIFSIIQNNLTYRSTVRRFRYLLRQQRKLQQIRRNATVNLQRDGDFYPPVGVQLLVALVASSCYHLPFLTMGPKRYLILVAGSRWPKPADVDPEYPLTTELLHRTAKFPRFLFSHSFSLHAQTKQVLTFSFFFAMSEHWRPRHSKF